MLLHEAITHARKELRLSQKKLSEMAGIQRRQLATLETGGNVTLSTLRKVLAHLPNLETFTFDTVTATVQREISVNEKQEAMTTAMSLLGSALQNLAGALQKGTTPDDDALKDLRRANDVLYQQGLGYSPEDVERKHQDIEQQMAPQEQMDTPAMTEEQAAEMINALLGATQMATRGLEDDDLPEDLEEEEEDDEDETNG